MSASLARAHGRARTAAPTREPTAYALQTVVVIGGSAVIGLETARRAALDGQSSHTLPGSRSVTSWSSHGLPSGSLKEAKLL